MRFKLWRALSALTLPSVKFGVKTAAALTLVAMVAFDERSTEVFRVWRGLWALITVRSGVCV